MFVDSHCHLNYLEMPDEKISMAKDVGVDTILCVGVEKSRIDEVITLANNHVEVWCSVGEHPDGATGEPDWIEQHLTDAKVVAVGETGLDYYHDDNEELRSRQKAGFDYQLNLSNSYNLPIIVHTRSAEKDTIDLIKNHPGVGGVLHCFTESWSMAERALELGFYISISGIVTFKNADQVKEVAKRIPEDRLLIETDAPWLAPVPKRGKTNEPSNVVHTAAYIASLRDETIESVAQLTKKNFHELFWKTLQSVR